MILAPGARALEENVGLSRPWPRTISRRPAPRRSVDERVEPARESFFHSPGLEEAERHPARARPRERARRGSRPFTRTPRRSRSRSRRRRSRARPRNAGRDRNPRRAPLAASARKNSAAPGRAPAHRVAPRRDGERSLSAAPLAARRSSRRAHLAELAACLRASSLLLRRHEERLPGEENDETSRRSRATIFCPCTPFFSETGGFEAKAADGRISGRPSMSAHGVVAAARERMASEETLHGERRAPDGAVAAAAHPPRTGNRKV